MTTLLGIEASQDRPISVHAQIAKLAPDISPRSKSCVVRQNARKRRGTCSDESSSSPCYIHRSSPTLLWNNSRTAVGLERFKNAAHMRAFQIAHHALACHRCVT